MHGGDEVRNVDIRLVDLPGCSQRNGCSPANPDWSDQSFLRGGAQPHVGGRGCCERLRSSPRHPYGLGERVQVKWSVCVALQPSVRFGLVLFSLESALQGRHLRRGVQSCPSSRCGMKDERALVVVRGTRVEIELLYHPKIDSYPCP
jgi:hypothetical protein